MTRFPDSCYAVWRRILRLGRGDNKKVTVRLQERQSFEAAQIKFLNAVGKSIKESPEKRRYMGRTARSETSGKRIRLSEQL